MRQKRVGKIISKHSKTRFSNYCDRQLQSNTKNAWKFVATKWYKVTKKLHEPSQLQLFGLHFKQVMEALSMYNLFIYVHTFNPYSLLFPPFIFHLLNNNTVGSVLTFVSDPTNSKSTLTSYFTRYYFYKRFKNNIQQKRVQPK